MLMLDEAFLKKVSYLKVKKTHCIINLVINAIVEPTVTTKDLPSSEFTILLSCGKL